MTQFRHPVNCLRYVSVCGRNKSTWTSTSSSALRKESLETKLEMQMRMDTAAVKAEAQLQEMNSPNLHDIAVWWQENLAGSGHKRLGRILLKYA